VIACSARVLFNFESYGILGVGDVKVYFFPYSGSLKVAFLIGFCSRINPIKVESGTFPLKMPLASYPLDDGSLISGNRLTSNS
jgi:hypothetical protein